MQIFCHASELRAWSILCFRTFVEWKRLAVACPIACRWRSMALIHAWATSWVHLRVLSVMLRADHLHKCLLLQTTWKAVTDEIGKTWQTSSTVFLLCPVLSYVFKGFFCLLPDCWRLNNYRLTQCVALFYTFQDPTNGIQKCWIWTVNVLSIGRKQALMSYLSTNYEII